MYDKFEALPFVKQYLQGQAGARLAVVLLGVLLALIAFVKVALSVAALPSPNELAYGEAVVYDGVGRLLRGEPLYQQVGQPYFAISIYPPFYYLLAAALQQLLGPGFLPGRILSFVMGLALVGMIAYLTTRLARDWRAGGLGAVLFIAFGLPGPIPWWAQFRVDLLAVALALGSVSMLVRGTTKFHVGVAALLAGLALLTKQSMIAATLASLAWLWWGNRQKAILFGLLDLALVLGVSILFEIKTGAFVANVIMDLALPVKLDQALYNLRILTEYQAGLLAAAGLYVLYHVRSRASSTGNLLAIYWFASLLPLAGMARVGSNHNYWIEPAAITAVMATSGVWRWLAGARDGSNGERIGTPVVLLAVNLAVALPLIVNLVRGGVTTVRTNPDNSAAFQQVIERVRSERREVMADPPDVVVLAGRPNWIEPWQFSVRNPKGQWAIDPIVHLICAHNIGLLVLTYPLESGGPQYGGYPLWPKPILRAIRNTMVFESKLADRYLYVSSPAASQSACEAAAS